MDSNVGASDESAIARKVAEMREKSEAQEAQAEVDAAAFAAQPSAPWEKPLPLSTARLTHAHNVAKERGDLATVQRISFELIRRRGHR
jgi:hypothetical protein